MDSKVTWPIDGKYHQDVSENSIYHNNLIDSFLHSDQRTLVIAAKGMGKTLLLRSKKNILEKSSDGHLIIPRDQEYDYPEIRGSISGDGLEDITLWKNIWTVSFIFSILSHQTYHEEGSLEKDTLFIGFINSLNVLPSFKKKLLQDITTKAAHKPSYYLCLILDLGVSGIHKFLNTTFEVDELSSRYIKSSACIFIDAFDQTLTENFPRNLHIWKNAQIGLIYAAHRIKTSNKHIKVYATIRQEAWAQAFNDDREVIKGQSVFLEYSKLELKQMFIHGIQRYSDYKKISSFLGLKEIQNGWISENEDPFDYIYRHCIGTPRSIMGLGNSLHEIGLRKYEADDRLALFREVINKQGAEHLYKDYLLSQRKLFLHTLKSEERIKKLFKMIPSNVLSGKMLRRINQQYARELLINEEDSHPFCELFNVGLLGKIKPDPVSNNQMQIFNRPQDFNWKQRGIINDDGIYLMHPSLHNSILDERGDNYLLHPENIIGDCRKWNSKVDQLFPQIFISHASDDKPLIEPFIDTLKNEMSQEMPCTIWYDDDQICAGGNISQAIETGVSSSQIVLVFISSASKKSGWVEQEWRTKHNEEISTKVIHVISCILDESELDDLPSSLQGKSTVKYNGSASENDQQMQRLVVALKKHLACFWEKRDEVNLEDAPI